MCTSTYGCCNSKDPSRDCPFFDLKSWIPNPSAVLSDALTSDEEGEDSGLDGNVTDDDDDSGDAPDALITDPLTGAATTDHPTNTAMADPLPGAVTADLPPVAPKKQLRGRPKKERSGLQDKLDEWLEEAHSGDSTAFLWPKSDILSSKSIAKLVRTNPKAFTSDRDLMLLLLETDDWTVLWASAILSVIRNYDIGLDFMALIGEGPRARKQRTRAQVSDESSTVEPQPPPLDIPILLFNSNMMELDAPPIQQQQPPAISLPDQNPHLDPSVQSFESCISISGRKPRASRKHNRSNSGNSENQAPSSSRPKKRQSNQRRASSILQETANIQTNSSELFHEFLVLISLILLILLLIITLRCAFVTNANFWQFILFIIKLSHSCPPFLILRLESL